MKNEQDFNGVIGCPGIAVTSDKGSIQFEDETDGELQNLESGMPLAMLFARQKRHNAALGDLAFKDEADLAESIKGIVLAAFYPIGSIYITTISTNPSTYMGGTWAAWGAGRVPVGVDTSQTEFDTVEETGGEKTHTLTVDEMPEHNHDSYYLLSEGTTRWMVESYPAAGTGKTVIATKEIESGFIGLMSTLGGDDPHNNLQPYITCYMWKRTE